MDINDIQRLVLDVICVHARTEKTYIAQKKIVELILIDNQIRQSTVKAAVRTLVRKGYIRKAVTFTSGTSYVLLRSL